MQQIGLFKMSRLEALSNTIFGVAMTLLAYDLPKASHFETTRGWADLIHAYAQPVAALVLSFIVAGVFLVSHHRRLAFAAEGSRPIVFLNRLFLLSIILLPVTNGLYGSYRMSSAIAVLYGMHLTVMAALNALLWFLALKRGSHPEIMATSIFPVFIFMFGTVVAFFAPSISQFVWNLAFGAPLAGWFVTKAHKKPVSG